MAGLSNYEIRHFERPDSSYPEYDRYFGYDDDEFEYCGDDKIDDIVNRYMTDDETVERYYRMGELTCSQ